MNIKITLRFYNANAYLCKITNLLHLLGIFFKTLLLKEIWQCNAQNTNENDKNSNNKAYKNQ